MDSVRALDDALAHSASFWSSFAEEDRTTAERVADEFDVEAWARVDAVWRDRPVAWQRCLASVLASVAPPQTVGWLFEMIERGADELALHAIDELRDFQHGRAVRAPWPLAALQRVRALWNHHRGFSPTQVDEFVDDLARGR